MAPSLSELVQAPKAERDVAVAAASILARDIFLRKWEEVAKAYGLEFPKEASRVVEFGKQLVAEHGVEVLLNVAKVHFATKAQITGGLVPEVRPEEAGQVTADRVQRPMQESEKEDERLEFYHLISAFEAELRAYIEARLKNVFGTNWWAERIPNEIRGRAEKLAEGEAKKGRMVGALVCLDFSHYEWLLLNDVNWEKAFRPMFQNRDLLRARLVILKSYWDPVAHTRGEITSKEKGEVVGAIHWMRKMMRAQTDITDSEAGSA